MFLGCLTNCLPALVPRRFAALVAAYSLADNPLIALDGKYRSPVALGPTVEGLPDFVRHFWSDHLLSDDCAAVLGPLKEPPADWYRLFAICALRADHCPALPPAVPALTEATIRFRNSGLVYAILSTLLVL